MRVPVPRDSPRRLMAMLAGLVLLAGLTGVVGATAAAHRQALLREAAGRDSELVTAALDAYQALSDADATTAGAFLAGGAEPSATLARYRDDLARTTAALTTAAAGAPDARSAAAIATIVDALPVYTGLVETARVYNRQGVPVGAAYLRQASHLNRDVLLPAAQQLYEVARARVAAAQAGGRSTPWAGIALAAIVLAGLAGTQVHLFRRTHRVLNPGLLAGSLAAAAALAWLAIATATAGSRSDTARRDGAAPLDLLAQARIAALQARGDEELTLIGRAGPDAFEAHFGGTMSTLDGLLARAGSAVAGHPDTRQAVETAAAARTSWAAAHRTVRGLDDSGRYAQAVAASVGGSPAASATLAGVVDSALGRAIADSNARYAAAAAGAATALDAAPIGLAALMTLAAASATLGLRPRIAEYR
ncbi:MAG TPA: hypothetical protein VMU51_21030 [Mycobacteriales bacterium]|nr:hypothetical protein [Mycobacteriales bacterium]